MGITIIGFWVGQFLSWHPYWIMWQLIRTPFIVYNVCQMPIDWRLKAILSRKKNTRRGKNKSNNEVHVKKLHALQLTKNKLETDVEIVRKFLLDCALCN